MPDVTMTILTPVAETYKSLRARAKSLAEDAHIDADFKHAFTRDEFRSLLETLRRTQEPVCLCCEITDGKIDTADDLREYLAKIWQGLWGDTPDAWAPDDWLRERPLIVMSEFQDIVRDLRKVEHAHPRGHSAIIHKLASPGNNRWSDVRDALFEGLVHA